VNILLALPRGDAVFSISQEDLLFHVITLVLALLAPNFSPLY
jgi:hypothetical protein